MKFIWYNYLRKLVWLFALHLNAIFPFLYANMHIFKNANFIREYIDYWRGFFKYKNNNNDDDFPLLLINTFPCLYDRYDNAGNVPKHYFHQDLWAAKKIYESGVSLHYDIGSRIDGFIAHCLSFTKVVMLDIRPINIEIENLKFIQTNAVNMANISSESIDSLSALHSVEHFGLGRYGDPIDSLAYKKVINEMQRIVEPGGYIYISLPIGEQRLEFNGHRVFDPLVVINMFKFCELVEFSAVDDNNKFDKYASPNNYVNSKYSCGLYIFKRINIKDSLDI